ncbi:DNA alkylation repair protein [Campylobacter sp. FMV-PI01]|uniref:DNA alkylation repair protein n=1 Tax=Campylobacter portucalensis TaxID=2608384 RepID=A0A6L5WNA1_9BACT|nr:DNA alkylation repair protein [Campylobacter portucalensis]MSN97141.1 DNA alkylation repair protein [Campylobacter portucalensis]
MREILEILYALKDEKYKNFNQKIIKTKDEILGVRVLDLRKIAKNLMKNDKWREFLNQKNLKIYELKVIYGVILSSCDLKLSQKLKIYDEFLKKCDNWALIDLIKFQNLSNYNKNELFKFTKKLLKNEKEFILRAGFVNLIYHFIDEKYLSFIFNIGNISQNYYDKMAHAWLISECFAVFPHQTFKFLESKSLDKFTQNKAISKCLDSFRISDEFKSKLKAFKK